MALSEEAGAPRLVSLRGSIGPFDAEKIVRRPETARGGALVALTIAWSAIGIGAAASDGSYSIGSLVLVTIGVVSILVTLVLRPGEGRSAHSSHDLVLVPAFGAAAIAAIEMPAGIYGSGPNLAASRILTLVATVILGSWFLLRRGENVPIACLVVVLMGVAGSTMILSSPRPAIDVWYMLQAATTGLNHGQNIYTIHWTSRIPGEVSNRFTYLPGAALLLWPFHAAFGDVRYGLLAAAVITGFVLVHVGRLTGLALAGALFVTYPRMTFGLEQSWIDPLTLCALSCMGLAMIRGRRSLAVVALAVALSCKQYNWLMVPFAALWSDFGWRRTAVACGAAGLVVVPWAAVNPAAFMSGAFKYDFELRPRLDSLSLYTSAVRHGLDPGVGFMLVGVVAVVLLGIWRLDRTAFGFFLGCAAVMSVFDLLNKLSFYNYWQLAAELALFAVVFGGVHALPPVRPPHEVEDQVPQRGDRWNLTRRQWHRDAIPRLLRLRALGSGPGCQTSRARLPRAFRGRA
jgi:hypothetical protein